VVPVPDRVVPPAPSTIDLHSHTSRSDGLLEPAQLVAEAAAAGVRLLAITDHDTLAGVREVLRPGADPLAATMEFIPGVEINALTPMPTAGTGAPADEVHIIGLGVDPADEAFEDVLSGQRAQRRQRFLRIVARLRELDMPIDAYVDRLDLTDDFALGRPTAARGLVEAGHASSVEDAFSRWLGRDAPAYVPRGGLGPADAIGAIKAAGGLAILAHFWSALERKSTISDLIDVGLGGIEVHHWSFDRPTVESVGAVAKELNLVPSGGTDYHGDLGPYAEIHAGLWVPPAVGEQLKAALRR
jgi:hypothetical protein